MIRALNRALFSLVAMVGLAGTAHAGYVFDSWTDDHLGPQTIGGPGNPSFIKYFHDLTGDGFEVGKDIVTDFELTINLYDDASDPASARQEKAFINVPGFFDDEYITSFSLGNEFESGWSIAGLLELNLLGRLGITITAITGDFVFGSSHLVAKGLSKTGGSTAVPEPSTLALLGLGLLGVAAGARRRRT